MEFDFRDSRFPSSLPIVGYVQDVLHEILHVDKNPVMLEVVENKPLVIIAAVFSVTISVEFLLLSDSCPSGERG